MVLRSFTRSTNDQAQGGMGIDMDMDMDMDMGMDHGHGHGTWYMRMVQGKRGRHSPRAGDEELAQQPRAHHQAARRDQPAAHVHRARH